MKKPIAMCIALLLVGSLVCVAFGFIGEESLREGILTSFTREAGTRDNPHMIYDVHDLQNMRNDPDAHYALANDIDASETIGWNWNETEGIYRGFMPIGGGLYPFTGTLDGQGYVVADLHINLPYSCGLFGFVDGGLISNIGLVDINVSGGSFVGGLVAYNHRGTVSNCYATGNVSGVDRVGGLVGGISGDYFFPPDQGIVTESYAGVTVSGNNYVGGLVGWISSGGTVEKSYFTGAVNGNTSVGGLVGFIHRDPMGSSSRIMNSYSTGDVIGSSYVGGSVGTIIRGRLENAYATGVVNGEEGVGGLIGYKDQNATVERSFWNIETSGQDESDGGTGLTTAEMIALSTFDDADWDITDVPDTDARDTDYIWNIVDHETYPFFSWQDVVFGPYHDLTINIEGGGSTEPEGGVHTYVYDTGVTITATPATGWWFSHWSGDVPEDEEESDEITIVMDGDKNITAHFMREEYTLEIAIEGEGVTDPSVGTHVYEYGDEVVVTATPETGWYFSHWSGDVPEDEEESDEITIFMDGDKTITAHFLREEYTLEITVEGEGVTDPPMGTHVYEYEDEVVVTATPATGWRFSHWSGDVLEGEEESDEITIVMDSDKNITAHFERIYHNLILSITGQGTIDPSAGNHTYPYGTTVNITATPAEGWYFSHWSGDIPEGQETNPYITITMDSGQNITAHFLEVIPPSIVITSPHDGETLDTHTVTVEWTTDIGTYPVSHYEIRLNDGDWMNVGNVTQYMFEGLEGGDYTVSVRAVDNADHSGEDSIVFSIDMVENGEVGRFTLIMLLLLALIIVLALVLMMWKKGRPAEPELDEHSPDEAQLENG